MNIKQSSTNIFLDFTPKDYNLWKTANNYSDEEILQQLQDALKSGWNIETTYGNPYNFVTALHICGKLHFMKSYLWLLDQGANPNQKSGNENTGFTFFLFHFEDAIQKHNIDTILDFMKKIQDKKTDLSLNGYSDFPPLIIYNRYTKNLNPIIVDFLIQHSLVKDINFFENIVFDEKLFTISTLKKIFAYHPQFKNQILEHNQYLDILFLAIKGSYGKSKIQCFEWLMNTCKISIEQNFQIEYFESFNQPKVYHLNISLLGLAIKNQNKLLFDWVLKKYPQIIEKDFFIENKKYSLLDFSLAFDFIPGIQFALKNMNFKKLSQINIQNLLSKKNIYHNNLNSTTLETLKKQYIASIHKGLKHNISNQSTKPTKLSNKI